MDETILSRRGMLAAGGLGLVAALAGFRQNAEASTYGTRTVKGDELGDLEKKSIKVVEDWLKAFGDPAPDEKANKARYDKIVGMMTPDTYWVFPFKRDPVVGSAAVHETMKGWLPPQMIYDLKIIDIWAHGPIVVTSRIDTRSLKGGKWEPAPGPLSGVFVVKDGKIAEHYEMGFRVYEKKV